MNVRAVPFTRFWITSKRRPLTEKSFVARVLYNLYSDALTLAVKILFDTFKYTYCVLCTYTRTDRDDSGFFILFFTLFFGYLPDVTRYVLCLAPSRCGVGARNLYIIIHVHTKTPTAAGAGVVANLGAFAVTGTI